MAGTTRPEEQVIVTAGGLDAFDLIGPLILEPGNKVWFVQEPGYPTAREFPPWRRYCCTGAGR